MEKTYYTQGTISSASIIEGKLYLQILPDSGHEVITNNTKYTLFVEILSETDLQSTEPQNCVCLYPPPCKLKIYDEKYVFNANIHYITFVPYWIEKNTPLKLIFRNCEIISIEALNCICK